MILLNCFYQRCLCGINSVQNVSFRMTSFIRGIQLRHWWSPTRFIGSVNGFRMNEPLGDELFFEIIPLESMKGIGFISGGSPLYGLNALGGAVSYKLKNGLDFTDNVLSGLTGSWGRNSISYETGYTSPSEDFGVILNYKFYDENSWREASPSDYHSLYINSAYESQKFDLNLGYIHGNSELTGNGVVPAGLLG